MFGCRIPVELIELSIDNLRGESGALLNCALTCKWLYPRTLKLLYIAIHIQSDAAYDAFVRRRLSVGARKVFQPMEELEFSIPERFSKKPFLQAVLQTLIRLRLPNLHSLAFHSGGWLYPTSTFRSKVQGLLPKTFASVRTLSLDGVTFYTFREFVTLVCALPQLRDLRMMPTCLLHHVDPTVEITVSSTTGGQFELQRLCIEAGAEPEEGLTIELDLFAWLIRTQTVRGRTLRSLEVHNDTSHDGGPWWLSHDAEEHMLKHLGPSLTDLVTVIEPNYLKSLAHSTGLETLTFTTKGGHDCGTLSLLSNPKLAVMRTLDSLGSPRLRVLRINLLVVLTDKFSDSDLTSSIGNDGCCVKTEPADLKLLDDKIAQKQFDSLQEVTIDVTYLKVNDSIPDDWLEGYHRRVEEEIKTLAWHTRGVLRVAHRSAREDPVLSPSV